MLEEMYLILKSKLIYYKTAKINDIFILVDLNFVKLFS